MKFFQRLLSIVIILKAIGFIIPIEFSQIDFRASFKYWHNLFLVGLLFFWILFFIYGSKSGLRLWESLMVTVPLLVVFAVVSLFLFTGLCRWEEERELYAKENNNDKIVKRDLNCGATTDYDYETFYIKPLTPLFNFIWKIDTSSIQKDKWRKVSK
ncbi:hypothetical protein [Runella aurantiaca]|uniref:Uncharacterized protein n=1 Tax=Runella aurantiaca TaxID=2282308 RepID=A0A369I3S0_9BACT|nr:hypothetical protein [Runella aurantiaca]RDB04208.1 hypothetical protein DVG78_19655 [Runella aurantiaca]